MSRVVIIDRETGHPMSSDRLGFSAKVELDAHRFADHHERERLTLLNSDLRGLCTSADLLIEQHAAAIAGMKSAYARLALMKNETASGPTLKMLERAGEECNRGIVQAESLATQMRDLRFRLERATSYAGGK